MTHFGDSPDVECTQVRHCLLMQNLQWHAASSIAVQALSGKAGARGYSRLDGALCRAADKKHGVVEAAFHGRRVCGIVVCLSCSPGSLGTTCRHFAAALIARQRTGKCLMTRFIQRPESRRLSDSMRSAVSSTLHQRSHAVPQLLHEHTKFRLVASCPS